MLDAVSVYTLYRPILSSGIVLGRKKWHRNISTVNDNYNIHILPNLFLLLLIPPLLQTISDLMQDREALVSPLPSPHSPHSPQFPGLHPGGPQPHAGVQQHLAVELADSKAKIRRLRQEL